MTKEKETKLYEHVAVVSYSGGLDSTCLLLEALANGAEIVKAVTFVYGQKHIYEIDAASEVIDRLKSLGFNIDHDVVDLTTAFFGSKSVLVGDEAAVPTGHFEDESMKATVVENRNLIFASILYGKALSLMVPTDVFLGVQQGDDAIYPDCRPEVISAANTLFQSANWGGDIVRIVAPFARKSKAEVIKRGYEMANKLHISKDAFDEIVATTSTCYSPSVDGCACGKCGACTERRLAFESLGMVDPATSAQNN